MKKVTIKSIRESDARIAEALGILKGHNRGLWVLARFKAMCEHASGLDLEGLAALLTLTQELADGRREFLNRITQVVLPPVPHAHLGDVNQGSPSYIKFNSVISEDNLGGAK